MIKLTHGRTHIPDAPKNFTIRVDHRTLDDIPIFESFQRSPEWLPRSRVAFYNYHISCGVNIFRVGEADLAGRKIYIYDHLGYQWAEYTPNPTFVA